jgi:hypothetical protein
VSQVLDKEEVEDEDEEAAAAAGLDDMEAFIEGDEDEDEEEEEDDEEVKGVGRFSGFVVFWGGGWKATAPAVGCVRVKVGDRGIFDGALQHNSTFLALNVPACQCPPPPP